MDRSEEEAGPFVVPGVVRMMDEREVVAAFPGGRVTKMWEEIFAGRWPRPARHGKRKRWYADEIRAAQERIRAERDATPLVKMTEDELPKHLKKATRNSSKARIARAQKKKVRAS